VLTFKVLVDGKVPPKFDLDAMYLVSQEGQPIRARFQYAPETGLLFCDRRSQGLAALALEWPVRGGSQVMLRTALLPDREAPYLLTMELARGRIADLWRKRDEWGYIYGGPSDALVKGLADAKLLLAQAETVQDLSLAASDLAEEAISRSFALGEQLAMEDAAHGIALRRRKGQLARVDFGCHWEPAEHHDRMQQRFAAAFNCATVPLVWRMIEPREHEYEWKWHDDWIQWLEAKGIAVKGGSLVRFTQEHLPDWIWVWENDFETVRDLIFDHIEQCVRRYRGRVDCWDAATGLHVENAMEFSLDRLIEVTRVCCHAVKRTDPAALVALDITQPWGEYYAVNQRSIWPYHYAEMCINAGAVFDVIGLQVLLGAGAGGHRVRDMLELSDLLDRFGGLGKPIHLTAVGVPSGSTPDAGASLGGAGHAAGSGGLWHKPWDETVQAEWANDFYRVAISKPYVQAISWRDFSDQQAHEVPHGGLLRKDMHPKIAYQRLMALKQEIWPQAAGADEGNIFFPEA
jgi:hypothetical protein